MAAKQLSSRGKSVLLLEARERLGGRIHTIVADNLPGLVLESGAEFIHGKLPATLGLLNEYKIPFYKVEGEMVNLTKEKSSMHEGASWDKLMDRMAALKKDDTLAGFLDKHFPGKKNTSFKHSIKQFASGFDLADPAVASAQALYREWKGESDDQFRVEGGYKELIDALQDDCIKAGCEIHTSSIVKTVAWSKGSVTVFTENGESFAAEKILITVPAGVLQDETKTGFVHFQPAIEEKIDAFKHIGFGPVIKILLLFHAPFWKSRYQHPGFFFTPQSIPTWWTQNPKQNNLLTGWLGGCEANQWDQHTDAEILAAAISSLALSFDLAAGELTHLLAYSTIINWSKEAFTHGGYSFSLLRSREAKKQLAEPIENTLYFAGEALCDGLMQGTVEAALKSAIECSEKMI